MTNEQMLSPYQDTTSLMREMEMQGIPVTMANLAIHMQKEEEMRQERMRYDQILQDAAVEKENEENRGKARMVESEEDEDTDKGVSSASEEWNASRSSARINTVGLALYPYWESMDPGFSLRILSDFSSTGSSLESWRSIHDGGRTSSFLPESKSSAVYCGELGESDCV
ncbi:hypothetical protein PIB30_029830 [Stylosanthes scabra]|uniref:Uncharacterized protein n=1 Tax=Stylosanthes scabra TaxID=79078 RepID=A0ABU6W9G0_9FABA|nr:hypothetical protein [Stylosanthes scabra]